MTNRLFSFLFFSCALLVATVSSIGQEPSGGGSLIRDITGGAALIFRAPQNPTVQPPPSTGRVGGGRTTGRRTPKPPVRKEDQFLANGNAARKAAKPQEAERQYRLATEAAPNDARAYAGLGNVFVDEGDFEKAVKAYKNAIERNKEYKAVYLPLAFSLARLGKYDDAIKIYEDLKVQDSTNPEVFNNLAVAYNEKGRYREAIDGSKRAIELLGDTGQAYAQGFQERNELLSYAYKNLGNAYSGLGDFDNAATALKRSTTIAPANAAAYFNLGLTLYNAKRYSEAIEAYRKVLSLRPSLAQAHYNLGLTYVAINDQKSAMEQYQALKTINSDLAKQLEKAIKR
jgi:tetratricopeptide (TPR) repeat protein